MTWFEIVILADVIVLIAALMNMFPVCRFLSEKLTKNGDAKE